MTNNICNSFKFKEREKVYVEYNIKDTLFKNLYKGNRIYIRELFPNKNSIKEAINLKCKYIFTKKGKKKKIGNIN